MGMLVVEIIEYATGFTPGRMARELGFKGNGAVTRYKSLRGAKKIGATHLSLLQKLAHQYLNWDINDFWQQIEKEARVIKCKKGAK